MRLPSVDVRKLMEKIGGLAENPRPQGGIKLSGRDQYRLRCGDYRILYVIEDDKLVICVIKVGHRREVYRK